MRISFLGTGAAPSCPLMFCRCRFCENVRKNGGPDFRKRSSLLVNQDLLIDLGPDVMSASFMHGISVADVRYWLQTHSHSDHFDPSHLAARAREYAAVDVPELELYASAATLDRMSEALRSDGYVNDILDPKDQERLKIRVCPVRALQSFDVGGYQVSAFAANHDASVDSLLYSVAEDNVTLFYGTDTGLIPESTWQGFHDKKLQFDLVVLDHTYGPDIDGSGHLNANQFTQCVQRMRGEGLLKEKTRVFATHLSHEGNPLHHDMVEYAAGHGYEAAYDGLRVEL